VTFSASNSTGNVPDFEEAPSGARVVKVVSKDLKSLSLDDIDEGLRLKGYIPDRSIVLAVYLALKLGKPLLVEGEPGCGKTELAKALAELLETDLIRLQCYEGIEASQAIYDWNYPKQLIAIRLLERSSSVEEIEKEIYSEKYIVKGPLLRAIIHEKPEPPVLLIDEIDRADEEFEAFLLEFLSEFQVTIPELGTFKAKVKPIVVLTSNRTRDIGDGLRRRCIYLYLTYPDKQREVEIVLSKVNGVSRELVEKAVDVVNKIRSQKDILKKPGISETIEWVRALAELGYSDITFQALKDTITLLVKAKEDLDKLDLRNLLGVEA
jgi:MoxR-like ATPase